MNKTKSRFSAVSKKLMLFLSGTVVLLSAVVSTNVHAHNNVVVIPMVGDGPFKPLAISDLIQVRRAFTVYADKLIIGNVTDSRGIIITKITVSPENYPAALDEINVRYCRTGSSCSHSISAPNNTTTTIDFGLGDILEGTGQHYLDLTSRGGLPQNVANQIYVFVSGYYYDK